MILYIGNYRDKYPYGSFVLDNILSLQSAGVDITCRPINPFGNLLEQNLDLKNLESKPTKNIKTIIQHVKPNFYEYKKGVKNIGFLEHNQSLFNAHNWPQCCNLLDEIWVTCQESKNAAQNSGVKVPIKIVLHGCEIDPSINFNEIKSNTSKDRCIFYSIFENNRLNNITGLIRAYYHTFNKYDNVSLLLFPYNRENNRNNIIKEIQFTINDLKKACSIYPNENDYPNILINCNEFNKKNVYKIHDISQIFVSCDRGLPWNIFMHEAMLFGNPIIASKTCANSTIIGEYGSLIDGNETPCINISNTNENMYTGKEKWFDPDLIAFSQKMKQYYKLWLNNKLQILSDPCKQYINEYNYKKIGQTMKEIL